MTSFVIQINDFQRKHLASALRVYENARASELRNTPSDPFGMEENALADIQALSSMLEDLPQIEDTHNIIHGLCL